MKKQLILLVMMLLPMVASADDSGTCGEKLTWKYSDATQTLTIEGSGDMYNDYYYSQPYPWSSFRSLIEKIIIVDGVTSIGIYAFSDCTNLTSITIPSSLTNVGNDAFQNCTGLHKVIVPDIAAWCKMKFGNPTTNLLKNAWYLYSDENTEIKDLVIPNSVKSIRSYAFSNCSSLTSVTIPNTVTTITHHAFQNCTSLMSITIPNSVTRIDDSAFEGCSSLTSITIPKSVTRIDRGAFKGCSSLESIVIPSTVTTIGKNILANCPKLTFVVVESGNPKYDSRESCNAIIETATNKITNGCAGSFIPSTVTTIGNCSFENVKGLTSITIPGNVRTIEFGAFSKCSDLKYLTILNGVTTIDDAAFEKTAIESIVIPESVTKITNGSWVGETSLFSGCSNLSSIIVENSNNVYDSRQNCNAIIEKSSNKLINGCKNSVIPNSVTSIGQDAFAGCSGLNSVTIPNSVTSIDKGAFGSCTSLMSITIPNSVTSIGQDAFKGVDLPTVISLIENPFKIAGKTSNNRTFSENTFNNATLYVPIGTIEKYKATDGWKDFVSIEEGTGPTGIEVVQGSVVKTNGYYNLNGRKLNSEPTQIGVYIHDGKKIIVK